MKNLFLSILLFYSFSSFGQIVQTFPVSFDTNIEIIKDGQKLALTGGFNSPQFSTIKADNDDLEDLFIFDRTTNQVLIFLQKKDTQNKSYWSFAPEYTQLFPKLRNWVLLRDYDNDGQKDIFASTPFGIIVYQNTKTQTGNLTFKIAKDLLYSTGITGNPLNLGIDVTDIPAILDLDNDGDMDILNFRPAVGTTVEWHKNLSKEKFSISDSLVFKKETIKWGDFEECICENYIFGANGCRVEKPEHAGSSLLILNLDNNPTLDLLVGDVSCDYITALFNQGTNTEAILRNPKSRFPTQKPIDIPTFSAVFYEDVTFDGIPDLLAAPNLYSNDGDLVDYENSAWLYQNKGTKENPNFEFIQTNFLQDKLFDIGENARPAFIDMDNDGDLDMIMGERGHLFSSTSYKARLHFLENTGTNQNPKFQYKNDDFLNFASSSTLFPKGFQFLKPIISDFNGDNKDDLLFTAFDLNTRKTSIFWIENKGNNPTTNKISFSLNDIKEITLTGINLGINDEILLTELNNDSKIDLLVLQNRGGIKSFLQQNDKNFVLNNANFGNQNFTRGSFALYQRNENGKISSDLLLSDPEKGLFLIKDFKNQSANFELIPLTLSTQNLPTGFSSSLLNSQNSTLYFGNTVFPIAFGSQIVIGTVGGGLQWLSPLGEIISGIDEENNNDINNDLFLKIYPNPASDILTIQTKEKGNLILYDAKGQILIEKQISSLQNEIDISRFATGLYILVFSTEKGQNYQKIIISK